MHKLNIKNQIRTLYIMSGMDSLHIAGEAWVALLALRGYSLAEIGVLEGIFHAFSLCGEMPSGVVADVLGRKKALVASKWMSVLSIVLMICSNNFWMIALAIGVNALSYNLASGTREALAYDSLRMMGKEEEYHKYSSNDMIIYRLCSAVAILCAGVALELGYRKAYALDLLMAVATVVLAFKLVEITEYKSEKVKNASLRAQFRDCVVSSVRFLKENPRCIAIIALNSVVGAVATLLLFFLQAKLPMLGLHTQLLGPALFFMGLGAATGAKCVSLIPKMRYRNIIFISVLGITIGVLTLLTGNPYIVCLGGFVAGFSDDFLQVRTDVVLNHMIPSEQRATLISVCSFAFSIVMIVLSPVMGAILD